MFIDLGFSIKDNFFQKNPLKGFNLIDLFIFLILCLIVSFNKFIKAQNHLSFELFLWLYVNYCKYFFSKSNFYFEKHCY